MIHSVDTSAYLLGFYSCELEEYEVYLDYFNIDLALCSYNSVVSLWIIFL